MILKIKKLNDNAVIPKAATSGSAGMDLYACLENDVTIKSGERVLIPTGIAIDLESNSYFSYIFRHNY